MFASISDMFFVMPLFEEFCQTSQESFRSESDPKVSWDDCQNSSKSGMFCFMPLFEEFWQTSQETFGSDSDLNDSWDVCPNSSKSGMFVFNATFRRILTNVPGIVRFEFRSEFSLGRLSTFLEKCHVFLMKSGMFCYVTFWRILTNVSGNVFC